MSENRWLEFHDSRVFGIRSDGPDAVLEMRVYVHSSVGRPGGRASIRASIRASDGTSRRTFVSRLPSWRRRRSASFGSWTER